jgi:arsenate reductase
MEGALMSKPKILFMCVANSCRSQMAEAIAKHHAGGRYEIYSAGSAPTRVNPNVLKVLREQGVNTTDLCSKGFNEVPREVDYAISLCSEQELACPAFPAQVKRLSWPMPDPAATKGSEDEMMETFRQVRDAIERKIVDFLNGFDR